MKRSYRAAATADHENSDPAAIAAVHTRAATWVQRHLPRALTFSLDVVVVGVRGISVTYLGPDTVYISTTPEGDWYRRLVWSENTDPYGYVVDSL
ncbi:hypothetical protein [Nocardioides ultimimeridianus]